MAKQANVYGSFLPFLTTQRKMICAGQPKYLHEWCKVPLCSQGLAENFDNVEVSVVECPDLTQAPFNLASKGLCGNPRVLDIGGVPYLVPIAQKNKLYDMKDYPKLTGFSSKEDCLIIGAGAAPWTYLERNAEVLVL